MSKDSVKTQIDTDITNKTTAKSISPLNVGENMKAVIDLIPDSLNISKVYAVGLTQSGVNPPTIYYEYKNDLTGNIIWSRFSAGQYIGTITTNEFTIKTFFPTLTAINGGVCSANTTSTNTFIIRTWDTISNGYADGLLNGSQFKIEIYT